MQRALWHNHQIPERVDFRQPSVAVFYHFDVHPTINRTDVRVPGDSGRIEVGIVAEILNCEKRDFTGTLRNRRLRKSGKIPAVLYGRGDSLALSLDGRDVNAAIRHGSQIVELKGDANESALIKDIQWDPFGIDVLHVDLTRIKADEVVELTLPVELVGEAPGTKKNGMVKHVLHSLEVKIPATNVPDKLEVKINDLDLEDVIKAHEVHLPDGAILITEADAIVVQCVLIAETDEEEAVEEAEGAEPEVIGRKPDEEDGGGDDS